MNNIKNIQYPAPKQEYKVLVRCFTFNHSKYIEDALNGFAMQQTNFPFVCLVMDDASTDGEQEVIKAWMERECDMCKAETIDISTSIVIIVPHKTNASCTFAFYLLKQNLYGTGDKKMNHIYPWREKCEYEALCEGDDYWIDPLKLQKQVDILDNDNDVGFVYTKFLLVDTNNMYLNYNKAAQKQLKSSTSGFLFYKLLRNNFPQTLTVVYRSILLKDYKGVYTFPYDWTLFIHLCGKSKAVYINEVTGCYRVNPNGLMHSNVLKVDKGGYKTLSCAFKAFLDGKYTALSKIEKLKVWIYLYYRVFKKNIENVDDIELRANSNRFYSVVRYFVFAIAKLRF